MPDAPRIVLASTSPYRASLLRRIVADFACEAPRVDESEQPGETPDARATRLATTKARMVAQTQHNAIVIGSDQVAALAGQVLHKPGNAATAHRQLTQSSGRTVQFFTAVSVMDTCHQPAREHHVIDTTRVHFRTLDDAAIERYIQFEKPFDCAGSFKCEGLGIALFERIDSQDPTALIGLPLIAVARLLRKCGLEVP